MDDITIEIAAELRDEASQPLKALTALSERFNSALDAMRARLSRTRAEASALAGALAGLGGATGLNPADSRPAQPSSTAGEALAIDASPLNEALAGLGAALHQGAQLTSAALGGFVGALNAGAGASAAAAVALDALSAPLNSAAQSARALDTGALGAGAAARSASGMLGQAGSAAGSAASRLSALGSAASSLSGRFAGFRLPSVAAHASGGILSTPHLGMVAESGPEAVIPLSASRRARGVELLRQAGRWLGVREYASGGVPALSAAGACGGINVGGVSVNISLGGGAEPARELELGGERIADQVAQAIAEGLERALRNMA